MQTEILHIGEKMVEAVLLSAGLILGLLTILLLAFAGEGTKGIEDEPYYGRKTGKVYTAKKERSNYIV